MQQQHPAPAAVCRGASAAIAVTDAVYLGRGHTPITTAILGMILHVVDLPAGVGCDANCQSGWSVP